MTNKWKRVFLVSSKPHCHSFQLSILPLAIPDLDSSRWIRIKSKTVGRATDQSPRKLAIIMSTNINNSLRWTQKSWSIKMQFKSCFHKIRLKILSISPKKIVDSVPPFDNIHQLLAKWTLSFYPEHPAKHDRSLFLGELWCQFIISDTKQCDVDYHRQAHYWTLTCLSVSCN